MAEMTVRRWQERFRAGDFNSRDLSVQCEAGWYDWFCRDEALAGRLNKLSSVVMGIQAPFILDNYYVWFKNNCPVAGPLYDDARFEPLSGERNGKYFIVSLDSPHEQAKWVLYTERYGYDAPEFGSGNVRDVVRYINCLKMFPEFWAMTMGKPLRLSSPHWMSWGTMSNGLCLTQNILESRNPGSGCSLSAILIRDAPEKYFLSPVAMERLLYKFSAAPKGIGSTTRKE